MVPGFDDAKTTEMRARLDDRLGLWAVTYLLFFVKLGPGLALFLALVFAIWIGWRWLCRKCPAVAWAVWWHVKAEGALVFVKACEMGPGGDRVEAGRQPLPERDEPQLAEVPEPGVSARG
jgi:hypothetical protein